MKVVRKVIRVGDSRGITLPPEWIKADYVSIEKRGEAIVLKPLREVA